MKCFKEFLNNHVAKDSDMIDESKLLPVATVQLRIRSLSHKLRNETDINKKIELLADMINNLSMLNVYNAMTNKRK